MWRADIIKEEGKKTQPSIILRLDMMFWLYSQLFDLIFSPWLNKVDIFLPGVSSIFFSAWTNSQRMVAYTAPRKSDTVTVNSGFVSEVQHHSCEWLKPLT